MVLSLINKKVQQTFEENGTDKEMGVITLSNRPDLSDFQCNSALPAAKKLKKNPREIATDLSQAIEKTGIFSKMSVDGPGFINLTLSDEFILQTLLSGETDSVKEGDKQKIIIDYGGPNVAKPLHVGHLRSAIIGESIKRIARAQGHEVIGDIHLGDWGTPMGMLIAKLELDHPEWPYFSEGFKDSPETAEPPLSGEDMNALYPVAAGIFKEDKDFADKARQATAKLQAGHAGYRKLWQHFLTLSLESFKRDFGPLDVDFDLWLGESDAAKDEEKVLNQLKDNGTAKESDGAIVINVEKEDDKHEMPPLILQKSDGAATYGTTDLVTIYQRSQEHNPDKILYVVDKRQSLHFTQVFRSAEVAGFTKEDNLEHIGFGTMNGKDGKPFKTRAGGVMRLSDLIQTAKDLAAETAGYKEMPTDPELVTMLEQIAIASIKFGDLQNLRTSDYVFDLQEFTRNEGKTGPYLQYSTVRSNKIVRDSGVETIPTPEKTEFTHKAERDLALSLLGLGEAIKRAFDKRMPSDICDYAYEVATRFNAFYHDCPVLKEEDESLKMFRLYLTKKTAETLEKCTELLAIPVPEKMVRAASE